MACAGESEDGGGLRLSYHNFDRAMGLAQQCRASGGGHSVAGLDPAGLALKSPGNWTPPGLLSTRAGSHGCRSYTGEIQGHELAWAE